MRKLQIFFVAGLVACFATPALAQTPRPNRPYRGLFGGGVGPTEHLVTVTFGATGGYDDDVLLGANQGVTPSPTGSGASSIAEGSGGVSYSMQKDHSALSATYGASVSFYPGLNQPTGQDTYTNQVGTASWAYEISKRTRMSASAMASYQPLYFLNAFPTMTDPLDPAPVMTDPQIPQSALPEPVPSAPISTDPVLGVRTESYYSSNFSLGVGHALTHRISTSGGYAFVRNTAPSLGGGFIQQSVSGAMGMSIAKGMGLHLGYTYSEVQRHAPTGELEKNGLHQLDGGINYNKALSLTRRTSLSFNTGTAFVNDRDRTHFTVTGFARLTRELGRTWTASAGFNRDVSFEATFFEPVISDAFSAGVGGMFNRRLQFQSSIGTSFGSVGYGLQDNGFNNYYAHTGLRYGISENLGLSLDYGYYWYDYGAGVILPPGVPSHTSRQSIRGGISYWTPVFHRARRSHAAR